MLLYVDIIIIIVLLCIGFYNKRRLWLWSLPIVFAVTWILLTAVYAVGNHFSITGFYDSVFWEDIKGFYPFFFKVSLICSMITECIRQFKKRKRVKITSKEGE